MEYLKTLDFSKWLEILKAGGWQLLALTTAIGVYLLLDKWEWIPPLAAWATQSLALAFLVTLMLWLASVATAVLNFLPPKRWILHWRNLRRERRQTRSYIPHMTGRERSIIAYLLAKNQKMFTSDVDGGYAATLISKGIVVRALVPGQTFVPNNVPFAIPDHIWDELIRHKSHFPYDPAGESQRPYPWYG